LFSLIIFFASHQLLCDLAAEDIRACGRLPLEKIELDAEDLTVSVQMAGLLVWDGTITVQKRLPATILLWHLSAKLKDGLKTNTEDQ